MGTLNTGGGSDSASASIASPPPKPDISFARLMKEPSFLALLRQVALEASEDEDKAILTVRAGTLHQAGPRSLTPDEIASLRASLATGLDVTEGVFLAALERFKNQTAHE